MKHNEHVYDRLVGESEEILRIMSIADRGSEDYAQLAANLDKILELENRQMPKNKLEKVVENGPLLGLITGVVQIGMIVIAESAGNLLLNSVAMRFIRK